jgi:hypothetical protein
METITNPDTNENVAIEVEEGPIPYTVKLTFGKSMVRMFSRGSNQPDRFMMPSYSLTMSLEDARELAKLLAEAGVEY